MNYKGVVFFDYDGTLADEKEGIYYPTDLTIKSLKQLRENGYLTILATGRSKCYAPDSILNFGGYVTANGAYAEIDGKALYESFIDEEDVRAICKEFDEKGLFYSLENQQNGYAKDIKNKFFCSMLENFNIPKDVFIPLEDSHFKYASKLLLVYNNDDEYDYLSKKYSHKFTFDKHRKFMSCDIAKKGINKAVGVNAIIKALGINFDNTYAFGDGTNDYGMLQAVGHGIAMGYHAPILDEVCETVCDTVENEGITKALKDYKLI